MTELLRIVVTWKNTVCLDMRRCDDGTWKTVVERAIPKSVPKKYKTGAWKRLMRQHKKSIMR